MPRLNELIKEGKERHAALTRLLKQPKRFLWLISLAFTARSFFKNSGDLSVPLIGFALLTLFLFYYAVPLRATRLFVRRASALVIDLIAISLLIVPSMVWYRTELQQPEDLLQISAGRILMLALWLAVMYFVVCDWHYGATIGKRMFALKVTDLDGRRVSFCTSFIRTFWSLPLPALFGVLLALHIESLPTTVSRLMIGDAIKQAFVTFIPMSILFFGGNQSVVDRLTHTVIRAEHQSPHLFSKISPKTWILLSFSMLAWVALQPSLLYFGLLKNTVDDLTRGLPAGTRVYWNASELDTTPVLWLALPLGLKTPAYAIRNIEIREEVSLSASKFELDNTHFFLPLSPETYLTTQTKRRVVRVTLARDRPSLIKVILLQNYEALINQNVPVTQRPFFSELQLVTENEYGLFSAGEEENFLLCALVSNNQPVTFYSPMLPHGAVNFHWSLDRLGLLLAGAGIPYSSQSY